MGIPGTITLWHEGRRAFAYLEVAAELGLVDGQSLDERMALRVIDLNMAAIRAREEASPSRNPAIRRLIEAGADLIETGLARIHARTEGR